MESPCQPLPTPLSQLFQANYKKQQKFKRTLSHQPTLTLICHFLTVPEVITLSLVNKSTHRAVHRCIHIENRLLKAQVEYLTEEEEKQCRYSPLYGWTGHNSAYMMFERYFQGRRSLPGELDGRQIGDAYEKFGKFLKSHSELLAVFRNPKNKVTSNTKVIKQQEQPKQTNVQTNNKTPAQIRKQQRDREILHYLKLSPDERKLYIINTLIEKVHVPVVPPPAYTPPDTFWSRLINKFAGSTGN